MEVTPARDHLLPLTLRLTKGHEVVSIDWNVEKSIQPNYGGPKPRELLGEASCVG